ncbi:alpha/beta fold hydrolase [Candidatus Saccharibacteria bacterium]|nr:alpha/beta fold hydrolase [Candidatus Saccharibacteria bacterium]
MIDLQTFWHKTLKRPYRLHTEFHGDPTRPAIVFIHGIAASGDDWSTFIPSFEQDYYCITIDLLGFGDSPKPTWCEYTMQEHTSSLFHTINKLTLNQDFILMGHSLGSFLAARYAHEHQANLTRLFLLSPPVYPQLDTIKKPTTRRLTGLLLTVYKLLRNDRMTPATFKRLSRILPLPKRVITHPDTWVPFMLTLQHCIEQQTILEDIATITVPTEVFYGSLDQVVINANVELLGTNPNTRLHNFIGTHELTKRYGKLVAKILTQQTTHTSSVERRS